jgi:hypothetical protein
VPRATFTLWRHDERHEQAGRITRQPYGAAPAAGFARVEVRPGADAANSTGITVRLHAQSAVTGELIGLDAETALRVLRLLLRHQRVAPAPQAAHGTADA